MLLSLAAAVSMVSGLCENVSGKVNSYKKKIRYVYSLSSLVN